MALAFILGQQVYIVLDEENVARITANDPFELTPVQTIPLGVLPLPLDVVIAYATTAEYAHIKTLTPPQLAVYLNRGYQFTASDKRRADKPPEPL